MMKALTRTILAVTALTAVTGVFAKPVVGKAVPAFSMTDLAGKKHTEKSLKGKVVIIDFWASWCGPCKKVSPILQELHTAYAKKGLVIIGANMGEQAGKSKQIAAEYAKKNKYTYAFTVENDKLATAWGVTGIPHFVVIDKKGIVRRVDTGFPGKDNYVKLIESLLK